MFRTLRKFHCCALATKSQMFLELLNSRFAQRCTCIWGFQGVGFWGGSVVWFGFGGRFFLVWWWGLLCVAFCLLCFFEGFGVLGGFWVLLLLFCNATIQYYATAFAIAGDSQHLRALPKLPSATCRDELQTHSSLLRSARFHWSLFIR